MRSLALILAVWMGCWALAPTALEAASGGTTLLPLPQPPPPPGKKPKPPNPRALTIKIDTTWTECNGYRPVRFTITPTPPLTVDRTLTFKLEPRSYNGGQPRITMTQDVELPAGAVSVNAVMAVPQLETWNTFGLDVFDDGEPVPELSVPMYRLAVNNNNNLWGDGVSPTILLLGAPKKADYTFAPFSRGMETAIPLGLQPTVITSNGVVAPVPGAGPFAGIPGIPSHLDLPTRWIDYSGLDIVYVELAELEKFIQEAPAQWKAIREWISTGGNLWIGGLGQEWERVAQLEELLELPTANSHQDDEPPGWTPPDEKRRLEALKGLGRANAQPMPAAATSPATPTVKQGPPRFRTRSLGQGQVLIFGQDDPLKEIQSSDDWAWIFNTAGPERWSWYRRHGISLQRENPEFWEFLIPGVGLAPVTEFQVLITLFVLVIGPVNFMLLRRWRKLNLIMITVPLAALAVTGALLLYALVADGLGVRVRGRSYTEIDQRRNETLCWTRLSYYAGLRPSQGLVFPTDTAIYPIEHDAAGNQYGNYRQRRVIDWRQKQYLGAGWLNARKPTQLLTVSLRPAEHKLAILETGSSPPVVDNLLGTRIEELLLVDSRGKLFRAENMPVAGKVTLTPTDQTLSAFMTAQLSRHRVQRPPGMTGDNYGLFGTRRRGFYYYNQTYDMDSATQRSSILERSLRDLSDSKNPQLTQPRSYVAIVDRSPEMTFGLEAVKEEASFHVIVGRY